MRPVSSRVIAIAASLALVLCAALAFGQAAGLIEFPHSVKVNGDLTVTGTAYNGSGGALAGATGPTGPTGPVTPAAQSVTVADNGGGTAATGTITPTTATNVVPVALTCSDADGCTMSMSETGATTGAVVVISNVSANAATFADSAGVLELPGGTSVVLGQNDTLSLVYANSTWAEVATANN